MLIYLLFYFIANTRVYFSSVQLVLFYFVANTTSWTERNHTWVLLSSSSYHGEHWPPSCMVAPIHLIYLQTHSTAPVYSTPPLTCSLLHALSAALVLTCPHCYQVDRTHSASQTCNGINNLGVQVECLKCARGGGWGGGGTQGQHVAPISSGVIAPLTAIVLPALYTFCRCISLIRLPIDFWSIKKKHFSCSTIESEQFEDKKVIQNFVLKIHEIPA